MQETRVSNHGAGRARRFTLIREILSFGSVGGIGVVVNFAVFNLARATTSLSVVSCGVVATCVAVIANYFGFRYFTYRNRGSRHHAQEFTLFVLFSLGGLVIENGVLYGATHWFGWDSGLQSNVFKALGIAMATCFRFCSYRTWVFRPHAASADTPLHSQAHR